MGIKWLLAGNMIYAALQFFVVQLLAQAYSKTDVGEYFFALSLAAPVFLFLSFKLPNLIVVADQVSDDRQKTNGFRLLASLAAIMIVGGLYFVFFRAHTHWSFVGAICLYKALECCDDMIAAYYQKELKFRSIFFVKVGRGAGYFSALALFVWLGFPIHEALLYSIVAYLVVWLVFNMKVFSVNIDADVVKLVIKFGFFLSLSSAISSLVVNGSRIYVGWSLGAEVLAIYGVLTYASIVFSIFVNALGQYYLPVFKNSKSNKKSFLNNIYACQVKLALVSLSASLLSYLIGGAMLRMLFGVEYQYYGLELCAILLGSYFRGASALMGTAVTSLSIFKLQYKITVWVTMVNFLLLPFMVSLWGFHGAISAFVAVAVCEFFIYILVFSRVVRRQYADC